MTVRTTMTEITATFGHRAFTSTEAAVAGISADRLQRAHAAGQLHRVARGVYVVRDRIDVDAWHLARARAAELRRDGVYAVIGSSAAAQHWGVPVLARGAVLPSVVTPPASCLRTGVRGGLRYLGEDLDPDDVRSSAADDLVTSPIRTGIDLIRHSRLSPRLAVATLSLAQRLQLMHDASPTLQQLRSLLAESGVRAGLTAATGASLSRAPARGTSYAASALALCDPRLESVLEGLSWWDFIEAGMPLPTPQAWVQGASGRWYCVDFLWDEARIIGEADGAAKYTAGQDVMAEKERQADLEGAGYRFVRWTWADAMGGRSYLARLAMALDDT